MSEKVVVFDTNIVLRFLLNDHPTLSLEAKKIIANNHGYLDEVILAEIVWVLSSFYKRDKKWISQTLFNFIKMPVIINPRKGLMLEAVSLYEKNALSYIDCWISVVSKDIHSPMINFDKKLAKLPS